MKWVRFTFALACLMAMAGEALAANCTNPIGAKDQAGTVMNFNTTVDGSNNCTSNMMPGAVLTTLSAWTSATGGGTNQTVMSANAGAPAILLQLDQTTTISAGAITFQGTYDGTNWTAIPDAQLLNPNTLAPAGTTVGVYTLQASTNKPFLILTQGYQGVRINLSTAITGSGTVTPFVNLLSTQPITGPLNNPLASNSPTTVIGGVAVSQTTPGTSNGVAIVGVNAATALAGNGVTGAGSPRVTIASDNTAFPINAAPNSSSTLALTHVPCGSAAYSCVLKASAGNFYGGYGVCAAACYLMVFNATSAPSNGATTTGTGSGNLVDCIAIPAGDQRSITYPTFPVAMSTGITAVLSSTSCGTLTIVTTGLGFIHGTVQ